MNKDIVFWKDTQTGCRVKQYELRLFLQDKGFGRFKTSDSRLESTSLFRNNNGVLEPYNENQIKRWVRRYLESIKDTDFNSVFAVDSEFDEIHKFDVLTMWQKFSETMLKTQVLDDLDESGDESLESDLPIKMFYDSKDECFIRFKNGVVKITKDKIELLKKDDIKNDTCVWESSILKRDIKITKNTDGMFSKFFKQSMYRQKKDVEGIKDWTKEYELNDSAREELTSLQTAYGYLIHDHNTADVSKLVFFIDSNSELGKPEGGNGKSVVMESIEHFKKRASMDGKMFNTGSGGQFQFSNVDIDSRFVMIDDIKPEFKIDNLFSMITGDMQVEKKGKDKFIIPADKKPKMGITSNFVLSGNDTSHTRRQHIVEFGSYWNRMTQEGETVSSKKHIGALLFKDGFNDDEWNKFYNFGFKCVQEYLKNGLKQSSSSAYLTKSIKLEIEGTDGTGQGTEWLINWIKNDRLVGDYHTNGISEEELYSEFKKTNLELTDEVGGLWSMKFFSQALWTLVSKTKGQYYNKHLASKGNTKTKRRWLMYNEDKSKQIPFVKITTDADTQKKKDIILKSVLSGMSEDDVMSYFSELEVA